MPSGRMRAAAVAATLAIVALIVGLLLRFSGGRPTTHPRLAHAVAIRTPPPPILPVRLVGTWGADPALTQQQAFPIIAPSDPRVVYEAYLTAGMIVAGGGEQLPIAVLRRSDDGGAS